MQKFYTISQAMAMYGRTWNDEDGPRVYERICQAVYRGECGKVIRMERGWLLNATNLAKLAVYMRRRWKLEMVPPAEEVPLQRAVFHPEYEEDHPVVEEETRVRPKFHPEYEED